MFTYYVHVPQYIPVCTWFVSPPFCWLGRVLVFLFVALCSLPCLATSALVPEVGSLRNLRIAYVLFSLLRFLSLVLFSFFLVIITE